MSTPTIPSVLDIQNNTTAPDHPSQPHPASTKANNRVLKNTISYTCKLRSLGSMRNDTDTECIRLRFTSDGTAADLAEESYHVCRMKASLRRELDEAKREVHAPLSTDDDIAHIQARLDDGGMVQEIAEEAYRVCRANTHLRKSANSMQADMHEMRKKMAVKNDASGEVRSEISEMRRLLERAWGLLDIHKVKVPDELRRAYDTMRMWNGYD
jgi:hypothetical protein